MSRDHSKKTQRTVRFTLTALGSALFLSGCALQSINKSFDRVDENEKEARTVLSTIQNQRTLNDSRSVLKQMNELWVDTKPTEISTKSLGAKATPLDCNLTFSPKAPVSLDEFSRIVMTLCGVSVQITADATQAITGGMSGGVTPIPMASASPGLPPPTLGPGASNMMMPPPSSSIFSTGASDSISGISWVNRPLSGLLDLVTARLGLGWKYDNNAVSIFYTDTRVFQLYSIPGKTTMSSKVASGATSGGGSGEQTGGFSADGSNQSTAISFETDIVKDIEKALATMISPSIGRMSVSPSTGTVTVTDRPDVLRRIKAFLDTENKRITRQVLLNVRVLSVQVSGSDSLGLDWNAVYESVSNGISGGIQTIAQDAVSAASAFAGVRILKGDTDASLLINALSQQGNVSTVSSPSVTTLNLKPAPILVGRQTTYLARTESTMNTGGEGSSQTLEPGTVTTGFNMTLLPYLMEGQDMLLQYSINLSALTGLKTIEAGSSKIEMPEVDNRIFNQSVRMRSGETLVLSGFDQISEVGNKAGRGSPEFWLLGGNGNRSTTRDVIIVLITPIVTD